MAFGRLIPLSYWNIVNSLQIRLTTYLTIDGKNGDPSF